MNKKITLLSVLFPLVFAAPTGAEPVAKTPIEEAIKNAPIIVLAEAGPKEFDNLAEGKEEKMTSFDFDCRGQSFKILKVYRNHAELNLDLNKDVDVYSKTNSCILSNITVRKTKGKLTLINDHDKSVSEVVEQKNTHEKQILFLEQEPKTGSTKRVLFHFGWFASPQKYSADLENKIAIDPSKNTAGKTIQLPADCDTTRKKLLP